MPNPSDAGAGPIGFGVFWFRSSWITPFLAQMTEPPNAAQAGSMAACASGAGMNSAMGNAVNLMRAPAGIVSGQKRFLGDTATTLHALAVSDGSAFSSTGRRLRATLYPGFARGVFSRCRAVAELLSFSKPHWPRSLKLRRRVEDLLKTRHSARSQSDTDIASSGG